MDEIFLKDIMENPADESIRLIYADYLQESGCERGEFIRLQIELANEKSWEQGKTGSLISKEKDFLRKFNFDKKLRYYKGFIGYCDIRYKNDISYLDKYPIQGVTVANSELFKDLEKHPRWKFVKEVDLCFYSKFLLGKSALKGKERIGIPKRDDIISNPTKYVDWNERALKKYLRFLYDYGLKKVKLRSVDEDLYDEVFRIDRKRILGILGDCWVPLEYFS